MPSERAGRLARRSGLALAGVMAGTALVLLVEIQLARSGSRLPDLNLSLDRPGSGRRLVWLGDSTAAGVGASTEAGALPRQVAAGLDGSGGSSVAGGAPGPHPAGDSGVSRSAETSAGPEGAGDSGVSRSAETSAGPEGAGSSGVSRSAETSVAVFAISGARVADVVSDQLPKVAGLAPDLVLISVGANDAIHLTGRETFRRSYEELVRALPPGVPVVLLGVPDMGAIPRFHQPLRAISGWRGRRLDAEIRKVAAATGAVYADIAGPTGPPFRRHPDRYFAADDFHPADAGYSLWADAVLKVLKRERLPRP